MRIELGARFNLIRKEQSYNKQGVVIRIEPDLTVLGHKHYVVSFAMRDGSFEQITLEGHNYDNTGFDTN